MNNPWRIPDSVFSSQAFSWMVIEFFHHRLDLLIRDMVEFFYREELFDESSSPRDLPHQALRDPNVNLSIHTAPIIQPLHRWASNEQATLVLSGRCPSTIVQPVFGVLLDACFFSSLILLDDPQDNRGSVSMRRDKNDRNSWASLELQDCISLLTPPNHCHSVISSSSHVISARLLSLLCCWLQAWSWWRVFPIDSLRFLFRMYDQESQRQCGQLFVPVVILAVDDYRLFWMEFKPDTVHSFIQYLLQLFCLSSAHTVA